MRIKLRSEKRVVYSILFISIPVEVKFALGKYVTDEDAGLLSVNLSASGLPDLNCGSPVDVTVGLANVSFDATPIGSQGKLHVVRTIHQIAEHIMYMHLSSPVNSCIMCMHVLQRTAWN